MTMVVTNARIVMRHEVVVGSLTVRRGRIDAIEPGRLSRRVRGAIDFDGDLLLPGLIELHTDNLEHHVMPRPKVEWPLAAAIVAHDAQLATAGVTTVFDSLAVGVIAGDNAVRSRLLPALVDAIAAASRAGLLRAEHRLHLRCELPYAALQSLIAPLADHPLVGLISLMDHTPGQRQHMDVEKFGAVCMTKFGLRQDELPGFFAARRRDQELYCAGNRAAMVAWARKRAIPLATHDDTTLEHVSQAIEDGAAIAEFPTTVEAARAARAAGIDTLCGAPNVIRGGSHSGNAAAVALARQGLLDILSSDYVPAALLPAAFKLVAAAGLALPEAVATVSAKPAEAAGLRDRGSLAPGLRADLLRVACVGDLPVVRAVWRGGIRVC